MSNEPDSVEIWPGQHDQNNSHDQQFSVTFLLIRPQFFLVVWRLAIIPSLPTGRVPNQLAKEATELRRGCRVDELGEEDLHSGQLADRGWEHGCGIKPNYSAEQRITWTGMLGVVLLLGVEVKPFEFEQWLS